MIYKSLFHSMDISAQGLSVQRTKMNTISENLANVDTTRTEDGSPYRRKLVTIATGNNDEAFKDILIKHRLDLTQTNEHHRPEKPYHTTEPIEFHYGVKVDDIVQDPSEFKLVYDPAHPDANEDGYVQMPNINTVQEMIDLITASRSYEANITALNSAKEMVRNALKI